LPGLTVQKIKILINVFKKSIFKKIVLGIATVFGNDNEKIYKTGVNYIIFFCLVWLNKNRPGQKIDNIIIFLLFRIKDCSLEDLVKRETSKEVILLDKI